LLRMPEVVGQLEGVQEGLNFMGGWLKSQAMIVGLPVSLAYANAWCRMEALLVVEAPVWPKMLTRVMLPKAVVHVIAASLPGMISCGIVTEMCLAQRKATPPLVPPLSVGIALPNHPVYPALSACACRVPGMLWSSSCSAPAMWCSCTQMRCAFTGKFFNHFVSEPAPVMLAVMMWRSQCLANACCRVPNLLPWTDGLRSNDVGYLRVPMFVRRLGPRSCKSKVW
jgi:hypothetical protein